jgi:hypothetical protein
MTPRSSFARAALVGIALAAVLACASDEPPSKTAGVNRGGYYGGTVHTNSFPETFGREGNYRVGRPAYRY